MTSVYLGLGSNIEPQLNIEQALTKLEQHFQVQAVSPWYCSQAQGFDGPNFINLVVQIEYNGELAELAQRLRSIEIDCGRGAQALKFASRTLDIDILLFGDAVGKLAGMQLPREDIYQYAYVLKPLLDILPNGKDPKTGQLFADFLPQMQQQWLEKLAIEASYKAD